MQYIRWRYGVPARVGAPVLFDGRQGWVTCAAPGGRVSVRLDGEAVSRPYHPTWKMVWLEECGPATRVPPVPVLPAPTWPGITSMAELVESQWSGV